MFHVKHEPFIVKEDKSYIAVYKPSGMHCVPLHIGETGTLLAWCAELFPEVLSVMGKKPIEGGIIHRLDFDTHGLVLFARHQAFWDSLWKQQTEGTFLKEYEAVAAKSDTKLPPLMLEGFPPLPLVDIKQLPLSIFSAFRPYGRGRKAVRPVVCYSTPSKEKFSCKKRKSAEIALDQDKPYKTEILSIEPEKIIIQPSIATNAPVLTEDSFRFKVRLCRGFRHQIRCHLAWLGYPLLNDSLYGGKNTGQSLALFAQAIAFKNPETGKLEEIRV
ncbi:RNA pseudouridine synthase [Spirochaetia bacterium]|nr:RNA pseudouridine synthase [Spirochaetia bacterium]